MFLHQSRYLDRVLTPRRVQQFIFKGWLSTARPIRPNDQKSLEDDPDCEGESDPFLRQEIKKYNVGKRWLARMMGEDPEIFTQEDVDNAIRYLLPSHLFAKDARPMLKHPYTIFPKRKESQFDEQGRPNSAGFFTGKPNYYDLTYKIWCIREELKLNKNLTSHHTGGINTDNTEDEGNVRLRHWMKKFQFEEVLSEKISEKLFDTAMFRLKKLANHERSNELQSFLQQYQIPVHTSGKEDLKDVSIHDGVARAMGYRKTAIAEVSLKHGSGVMSVNNRSVFEYFKFFNDREQIMFPLILTNTLGVYDINAHVIGGGTSGKSGAIRLGLSRAIATLSPEHFDVLNNEGLLLKDLRIKERKKPGRKRARRAFQWVKR